MKSLLCLDQLEEKEEDIQTLLEELQRVRAISADNAEKLQQMELVLAEKTTLDVNAEKIRQVELALAERVELLEKSQDAFSLLKASQGKIWESKDKNSITALVLFLNKKINVYLSTTSWYS